MRSKGISAMELLIVIKLSVPWNGLLRRSREIVVWGTGKTTTGEGYFEVIEV
jgi:hypothetical protein